MRQGKRVLVFAIVVGPILIAGLIAFLVLRHSNKTIEAGQLRMAELDAEIARAMPAQATVVSSATRGMFENGAMCSVDLQLEVVSPSTGKYVATTKWQMNTASLSMVQPGQTVAVKIDAHDRTKIYPNVGWAKYWPH